MKGKRTLWIIKKERDSGKRKGCDPRQTAPWNQYISMTAKPYYDSAVQQNPGLEEVREVSRYRYLLMQLTRRDILARYKRSVLGGAWTMLNSLVP